MSINQIVPGNISNTNSDKTCIICMDESQEAIDHTCNICKKNAWKACSRCLSELDTCPVCRTRFNPIDPNNIHITIRGDLILHQNNIWV